MQPQVSKHTRPGAENYIISYPKSGRTWLRSLIGKYLCESLSKPDSQILDIDVLAEQAGLPAIKFSHDNSDMHRELSFRELNEDKSDYQNTRVLFMSRNIKDTLVSAYFQATRRTGNLKGTISEFIRTTQFGAIKIVTFYNHWLSNMDVPRSFLLISYEQLQEDPAQALKLALDHIGIEDINTDIVNDAVAYCSFENMKKLERDNAFNSARLKVADQGDPESFKVRKGKVGNYREYLGSEDIDYIDSVIETEGCALLKEMNAKY